jgi:hypothetical protein
MNPFYFSIFVFACSNEKSNSVSEGSNEETVDGTITDSTEDATANQDRDLDGDGYLASEECDDGNTLINPSMPEICDGVDNNCDGNIDEGVTTRYFLDGDMDGFGDSQAVVEACSSPPGYVTIGSDCNDANNAIFPGASEVCNEVDDDCDGAIDEDLAFGLYLDADGDGHGDPNHPLTDCTDSTGYVFYNDDCDDTDANRHPFNDELCDGIDNNCDGRIDETGNLSFYADIDEDGFGDDNTRVQACTQPAGYITTGGDCDDINPLIHPTADEYCNNIDDDCDGSVDEFSIDAPTWYYDIDGDGYGSAFIISNDCNQPIGYTAEDLDCDDTRATVNPDALEVCNSLDDDCSGLIDDNATDAYTWYYDGDNDDFGDPAVTLLQCTQPFDHIATAGDCDDAMDTTNPNGIEICNNIDDNCDGIIDNDAEDAIEYFADLDGDGFGDPFNTILACTLPLGYVEDNTDCDDNDVSIFPGAQEFCDGVDQNCDGNNFYELDLDNNGLLACEESLWIRNSSSNSTSPNGACSQAAGYLLNDGITIHDEYHGNTIITSALLENFGLYVHHGNNIDGSLGAYTNSEATAIEDWVYNGGRMLFIGYHSTQPACEASNSIPYQFGVSCDSTYFSWNGTTNTYVSHPITDGLASTGGLGGENWVVTAPAQVLASVGQYEFLVVVEHGAGKVVLIADEWPYYNPRGNLDISYGSNRQLVQNIWNWLLE